MLKNYLLVALRRFRRGGTHALLNVAGLALGMATCSLIFLLIFHEWSFDRFHEDVESIHRVHLEYFNLDGDIQAQSMMPPEFTPELKASFPAITHATRFVTGRFDLTVDDRTTRHQMAEVDADFFEIFSFDVLAGDPVRAIADPTSMVVGQESAERLFGEMAPADVVGRVVTLTDDGEAFDFRIGAVLAPIPNNSSIQFDVAISFENYDQIYAGGNNWGGRTSTYVTLADGTGQAQIEAAFPAFTASQFGEYIEGMRQAEQMSLDDDQYALRAQPMTAIHTNMDVWLPYEENRHNPLYSYILTGIGLLILLIACINFMTLSVGQSALRAREVGVRKVLGAARQQIMRQHWGESIVTASVALGLGLMLALSALPAFNNLVGTTLSLATVSPVLVFFAMALLVTVVGVVAGGYPAIVLSRFLPVRVLKGAVDTPRNGLLTRSLVVLQFTISIGLMAATGIMTSQLSYLLDKDLGFDQDFVLAVNAGQVPRESADGLVAHLEGRLLASDAFVSLSRTGYTFTRGSDRNGWGDESGTPRSAYNFGVGYDWLDVLGMEIVEGRNFSRDRPSDPTSSILVNEALVREFGIEEPIGHVMTNWLSGIYEESPTVIGVVKDFNFRSLHEEVYPAIMNMHPDYYSYMNSVLIKMRPGSISENIAQVERVWGEFLPGVPFDYSFVDEDMAAQYETEQRWQRIVTYASLLAILIACLGLFGLAVLTVGRRTKEIGVRKVLGASVPGVTALLSKEFVVLVLLAAVLASPIAWFAMDRWLDGFAFRVGVGPLVFVAATALTLAIALITVGVHAVRAASSDPVKALRYE